MSIPRRDPNFTMADLDKVGEKLLAAGQEYWDAAHKAGIGGAVIWLQGDDGKLVIFTRSEYRSTLMEGIERVGPTRHFGRATDE